MCAVEQNGPFRHVGYGVDKRHALQSKPVDDVLVVDDFVAHIARRAVSVERAFDNFDGAFDPGAEPAWVGQQNG